jgi:hypothetical protein
VINLGAMLLNLGVGTRIGSTVNLLCAGLSAAVAVLLFCGLQKLNEKKARLEKESQLIE